MTRHEPRLIQVPEDVLSACLPALGCHGRDFVQRALIEICELLGTDPYDWSHYPDVLARLGADRRTA